MCLCYIAKTNSMEEFAKKRQNFASLSSNLFMMKVIQEYKNRTNSGAGTNFKVGGGTDKKNFLGPVPPLFWL